MSKRVLGMGNAVLDILAETKDDYLIENKLQKGVVPIFALFRLKK